MAESVVTCLLSYLSTLLQQEQNLLGGLKSEVQKITDDLQHMRVFLRDADSKEQDDPGLKVWTGQLREIAYDVQDVLDQYMLEFANYAADGFSARIKKNYDSIKGVKSRHQFASQIQEIKSRLGNASQSYQMFKDKYLGKDHDDTCYDGREDALYLLDAEVVGIENPKSELLRWLKSTEGGLKVISVVGMGGMGKTTLVRKVYDDRSLKGNFDHHVWITVSESYKVEDLLAEMIKKLSLPQQCGSMKNEEMIQIIYNFLQGKTFIVVLDDIWRIHAWESIRNAFPRDSANCQGCIIITTRFNDIANVASSNARSHVYNLEPLTHKYAEELFYKKVFRGNSCPLHLTKISDSILKKCNGLPLAIVVIGGLLATKNNNIQAWEMFNRSIGDELEGDGLKRLNKIISLSFYDLPYYLKSCFLYLSIFPEDKLLEKWKLIQLWIVEGFVQESRGKTMEEVAEGYFNELVNRSLIQVVGTHLDGTVKSFRIHDLLREYIVSKTKDEVFIVGDRGDVRWPEKIRRIALNTFSNMQESYTFDHLRTLLWLGPNYSPSIGSSDFELGETILRKVLGRRCRLLKVLEITGAPLKCIPYEVFKLYHLKYLNLRGTRIKCIPKSIKNLVNLETLDANNNSVMHLPTEVVKLKKLRHLLVGSYINRFVSGAKGPTDIGSLTSLQTLKYLSAEDVKTVREIGKLTQLRQLGLADVKTKDGKDLCSSISKLYNLQELHIYPYDGEVIDVEHPMMSASSFPFLRILHLHGRLQKIPSWTSSLDGLTELCLGGSHLSGDQDPLELIQVLPSLLSLELSTLAYVGEGLTFRTGRFQRLKHLKLVRLENLRWVKVEEGCMPYLQKLFMEECKLMAEVPEGLRQLHYLQSAKFREMPEEFRNGVADQKRKGKEWELGHVSKVVVSKVLIERGKVYDLGLERKNKSK